MKIDTLNRHLNAYSCRLRIQTLEAEKNELLDDVSRMRELTSDGTQPLKMVCIQLFLRFLKFGSFFCL